MRAPAPRPDSRAGRAGPFQRERLSQATSCGSSRAMTAAIPSRSELHALEEVCRLRRQRLVVQEALRLAPFQGFLHLSQGRLDLLERQVQVLPGRLHRRPVGLDAHGPAEEEALVVVTLLGGVVAHEVGQEPKEVRQALARSLHGRRQGGRQRAHGGPPQGCGDAAGGLAQAPGQAAVAVAADPLVHTVQEGDDVGLRGLEAELLGGLVLQVLRLVDHQVGVGRAARGRPPPGRTAAGRG